MHDNNVIKTQDLWAINRRVRQVGGHPTPHRHPATRPTSPQMADYDGLSTWSALLVSRVHRNSLLTRDFLFAMIPIELFSVHARRGSVSVLFSQTTSLISVPDKKIKTWLRLIFPGCVRESYILRKYPWLSYLWYAFARIRFPPWLATSALFAVLLLCGCGVDGRNLEVPIQTPIQQ